MKRKLTLAHAIAVAIAAKKNLACILKFSPAIILAMMAFITLNSNAQTGVTRLGTNALANNTVSGIYNTGLGYYSLNANTTGNKNTATGANTLRFNTTGISNTAAGYAALYASTTGAHNTAFGTYALFSNTNGNRNTAIGNECLYYNTTGIYNTAIGYFSMNKNTTGHSNIASGHYSLYSNTSGYYNCASGTSSLTSNTTGMGNVANGTFGLQNNTTGIYNAATGHQALVSNTSGNGNTANGAYALVNNTTGIWNTALGYYADVTASNLQNASAFGYAAKVDASNKVRIGNTLVTSIGGQVSWTTFSDGRYKNDIKENIAGLAFINSLRPVSYTVNIKGLNEYFGKENKLLANDKPGTKNQEMPMEGDAASKIVYNGFLAQEVEEAAKKLNFEFSGVDKPQSKDGLYGLRYDNFVVPLVKAVQELSSQNEGLKKQIEAQQKINLSLQDQIDDLKSIISKGQNNSGIKNEFEKIKTAKGYLEQNRPNPFNESTNIQYLVPDNFTEAFIVVSNLAGQTIKQFAINTAGAGVLKIGAGSLASGTYAYSLWVDGRQVITKKMLVTK